MHNSVQRQLGTLDISTFSIGDVLHYCEDCEWQSEESYAMKRHALIAARGCILCT